jgi:hypothetical protein
MLNVGFLSAGDILANTPEQVITAFQRDYKSWNDPSFQRNQIKKLRPEILIITFSFLR